MMSRVQLVDHGEPRFALEIWPSQDAEGILPAILEFVKHFEICVGHPVVWFQRGADDPPPNRLVFSFSPERGLDREEFEVAATEDTVRLTASTVSAMGHAVSWFLEQAFGVRWLWPGDSGTVTPRRTDVSCPEGTTRVKPDWQWRRIWLGGAFWEEDDPILAELKQAGVSPATLAELEAWQRRNRLGGLNIADGHRWAQICSPLVYGETHPEYFALVEGERDTAYVDGKHGNQPCTSHPDVIGLTADYVIAQFNARPELDGFSIAINDGFGFCECESCRAIDDWAGAEAHREDAFDKTTADEIPFAGSGRSLSDRMLKFANDVAERVEAEVPDKLLLVLIYSLYRDPPRRVKLRDNVIAQFCTASWAHAKPSIHAHEIETLKRMTAFTSRQGIYDYFVNGVNGSLPRGFARVAYGCQEVYHAEGCRYFATQAGLDFAANGFAYYMTARHLWNGELGFDEILDDYCRSGFGKAAEHVKQYQCAWFERWDATEGGTSFGDTDDPLGDMPASSLEVVAQRLYPPAWRAERRADLDLALHSVRDDADAGARVHFLLTGLDFVDVFCEAAEAVTALLAGGAPEPGQDGWQEQATAWARGPVARKSATSAIEARERLRDWVSVHSDGFWISAMWFRYQQRNLNCLLGKWLDVLADALR